MEKQC